MSEPLSDKRLREIRERATKATPGPWFVGQAVPGILVCSRSDKRNIWADEGTDITSPAANMEPEDAEFAAHARADVPALLAEIDRLLGLTAAP